MSNMNQTLLPPFSMATCRRPSELASLKVDTTHFSISPSTARFIPSRLSKTDRPGHMGRLIYGYRFLADPSLCPVEAIRTLISTRTGLKLQHPFLFFSASPPYSALSPPAFSRLLAGVLRHADVHAPPGSTRAAPASAAFLKGTKLDDVLRAGDWSNAMTFFRHC